MSQGGGKVSAESGFWVRLVAVFFSKSFVFEFPKSYTKNTLPKNTGIFFEAFGE